MRELIAAVEINEFVRALISSKRDTGTIKVKILKKKFKIVMKRLKVK